MLSPAKLGLEKRISLLVLVGLTVGLSLFSWLGVQSLNESTNRILDQRLTIARIMATHLDETLTHVLLYLQSYATVSDRLPTEDEFSSLANSLHKILADSNISLQNIILAGRDGKVRLVEPESPGAVGTDISQYPEVAQVLKNGRPTISNLITNLPTGSRVVLATVPILNQNNEVIGILASSIDVDRSPIYYSGQTIQVGVTGYTEIVDGNGVVLTRTEPGSPPKLSEKSDHPDRFAQLIKEGKATVGTCHRCHETGDTTERRRDVLAFAPLSTASWAVAIRQAQEEALAPTQQLETRLFLLGIVVVIVTFTLLWLMMQGVVRPIRMLTVAAKKVAVGDFKAAVPLRRQDEIGELSTAFYSMTQELAKFQDKIVSRNEELSALNSIATTVSQSLHLNDVLENALQKVLEITRTTAGCIFLRNPENNQLEMMSYSGRPNTFRCQESGSATGTCACHWVLRHGQTLMVNDVSQCPMLGEDTIAKENTGNFVSVPLKSKNRTLGIMNIEGSGEYWFTEDSFRLLDSIGYYVGLAIENSVLYKEAKEKEEMRGQLLSSVITAQEEERKRIARELHDGCGQTLTGLIMAIESLEDIALPTPSQIKGKLNNAKSLVGSSLEDIRRLTLDLRPSTLDYLGLVATVRSYTQTHLEALGIRVDFKSKGLSKRLPPVVEIALFRIIQEAIHNITKYAEARNVKIQLEAKAGIIEAIITDDGKGFDIESVFKTRMERQSLGLLGIEERAILLGGTFTIESQIGKGTCLTIKIPLVDSRGEPNLAKSELS